MESVNATPFIEQILSAFVAARLEAILIGNSGAAIQGAPVTTDDFDWLIRDTESNLKKLERVAILLGGQVTCPNFPLSSMLQIRTDDLQLDFMVYAPGMGKFESVRSRSMRIKVGSHFLRVADLGDIIRGKKAAGRLKDLAVMPILEETRREKKKVK